MFFVNYVYFNVSSYPILNIFFQKKKLKKEAQQLNIGYPQS